MTATTCTIPAMPKRTPENEKKTVTVCARVSADKAAELERLAAADDRTISYIVAKAIQEYLDRSAKQKR